MNYVIDKILSLTEDREEAEGSLPSSKLASDVEFEMVSNWCNSSMLDCSYCERTNQAQVTRTYHFDHFCVPLLRPQLRKSGW